jgi:hypothetical protein
LRFYGVSRIEPAISSPTNAVRRSSRLRISFI